MNRQELIEAILLEKDGVITTADALKHQISKPVFLEYVKQMGLRKMAHGIVFLEYVKQMGLRKMAHGIYASDDAWPDIFRQIQMQYASVIFSHESSLYLHGISEREPDPIAITVKRGYHSSSMKEYGLKIYTISPANIVIGLTVKESGYPVRCYNIERTLCDLLRSQRTVDYQELTNAFRVYVKRRDRDVPLLMRYGETFRVTKKLKSYMEVLL